MADKNYELKIGTTYDGKGVKAAKRDAEELRKEYEKPVYGPTVKPRYNSTQSAIRDEQAGIIRAERRRAEADRQRIEREAINRVARQDRIGRSNLLLGRDTDVMETRAAIAAAVRERRRNERIALTGTGYDDLQSTYVDRTIARRGAFASVPGAGRGRGMGALGAANTAGQFLKLEDKLNLGGGAKLNLGAAAAGIAAVAALGKAADGATQLMTTYRDKLSEGMTRQEAWAAAMSQLTTAAIEGAKQLPIIGNFVKALDRVSAEITGDADRERRNAAASRRDQQRADWEKNNAGGIGAIGSNREQIKAMAQDERVRRAVANAPERQREYIGAVEQAKIDRDNAMEQAKADRQKIANIRTPVNAEDAARVRAQREAGLKANDNLQKQIEAEYQSKIAKAREDFDKQDQERRIANAEETSRREIEIQNKAAENRIAALEAEGRIGEAMAERLALDVRQAQQEAADLVQKAERDAKETGETWRVGTAQSQGERIVEAAKERQEIEAARIAREARLGVAGGEVEMLRRKGALGDMESKIKAEQKTIELEGAERDKKLQAQLKDAKARGDADAQKRIEALIGDNTKTTEAERRQAAEDIRREAFLSNPRLDALAPTMDAKGVSGLSLKAQEQAAKTEAMTKATERTAENTAKTVDQLASLPESIGVAVAGALNLQAV